MFRQIAAWLLALTLTLGMAASAGAESGGDQALDLRFDDAGLSGAAVYQGRIILSMGYDSPKELDLATGKVSDFLGISPDSWRQDETLRGSVLISDGDELYALNLDEEQLTPLAVQGDKLTAGASLAIDLSSRRQSYGDGNDEESYIAPPEHAFMKDGRLYLLFRDYDMNGPEARLLSFDLSTGAAAAHEIQHLQAIAPYKDGQLLASIQDMNDSWDANTNTAKNTQMAVVDLKNDSVTPLGDSGLPIGNGQFLAYDAASDSIYILHKAEIHRWEGEGRTTICAYLATANLWGFMAGQMSLLPGGRILAGSYDTLNIRGLDPEGLPAGRISIYGGWEDDIHRRAVTALSGMPMRFLDDKWFMNAQELGQALVSGEDEIDVLVISSGQMDFDTIVRKGYALDLSDRAEITAFADATYPMMQEIVKADGRLYGVPIEGNTSQYGYRVSAFKKLGTEPPKTFEAYCQFLANWEKDYGEAFPELRPTLSDQPYDDLVQLAFSLYSNETVRLGEEFSFSSPILKALLQQAEAVKQQVNDLAQPGGDAAGALTMAAGEAQDMDATLFDGWYSDYIQQMGRTGDDQYMGKPLDLAVADGIRPLTPMELRVMFINPNSKNLEGAVRYVEAYLREMGGGRRAALMPDQNEPVENPSYPEMAKQMEVAAENMKRAVEKAEGAEKTQLAENLKQFQKDREAMLAEMRYLVTPEGIAEYRERMRQVYIRRAGASYGLVERSGDVYLLLQRYTQGNISLDQFLNEAEGKLRLMRLENQ